MVSFKNEIFGETQLVKISVPFLDWWLSSTLIKIEFCKIFHFCKILQNPSSRNLWQPHQKQFQGERNEKFQWNVNFASILQSCDEKFILRQFCKFWKLQNFNFASFHRNKLQSREWLRFVWEMQRRLGINTRNLLNRKECGEYAEWENTAGWNFSLFMRFGQIFVILRL